jgi:hypothetical protein
MVSMMARTSRGWQRASSMLLQPSPQANVSSMQGGVSMEPREERQGGSMSRVESSSRHLRGGTPPTPVQDQLELPLHPPKTFVPGPQTRGWATLEDRIMTSLS